jgi:hypothetical protein
MHYLNTNSHFWALLLEGLVFRFVPIMYIDACMPAKIRVSAEAQGLNWFGLDWIQWSSSSKNATSAPARSDLMQRRLLLARRLGWLGWLGWTRPVMELWELLMPSASLV